MKLYNLKIKPSIANHEKYLYKIDNSMDIYKEDSDGTIISPFNISFINIDRLMLINFENDPVFNGIELQEINIENEERPIVILFKNDESQDVYYLDEESMKHHRQATKKLLNNPSFNLTDKIDYKYELDGRGLDAYLFIVDKDGMAIEFKVKENKKKRELSGMLAPVGASTPEPKYFPYMFLEKFGLVVRKNTIAYVRVNENNRTVSEFPVRVEGDCVYFIRFCLNPIMGYWNEEFEGNLAPIEVHANLEFTIEGIKYSIKNNYQHFEIESISKNNDQGHKIFFEFSPAIPDLKSLRENIELKGRFSSGTDERKGLLIGTYEIVKKDEAIRFVIKPTKAWQPFPGKSWVSNYIWEATINLQDRKNVVMKSKWKNLKRLTSDEFLEITTKKQ